jgi:hypothetical protein
MVDYWIELAQKMAEAARKGVAEERRKREALRAAAATSSQSQQVSAPSH